MNSALWYLDANRNLDQQLNHSRWTLFGRIIRQLDADFNKNAPTTQKENLEKSFEQARDLLKTELYQEFEETFRTSFDGQLKRTTHNIDIEFRTFDPLSYYRSIRPVLKEEDKTKNPLEAGQGMRNLILLALFRTYAKVFEGDAIIAIEEPEIYLHPHAQRSLAALFTELAGQGNQIFYSTHSGNFIDIEHFDQICLIEKKLDSDGDTCSRARQVSVQELLAQRLNLYPNIHMTEHSLRERYRNICGLEHNEAFFAQKIVLVEGETEEYALPIYAQACSYDFDVHGVSVVNAHGKNNLDQFYQLYCSFGIPVYLVFDNDHGGEPRDLKQNKILLHLLKQEERLDPPGTIMERFAILDGNFENEIETYVESLKPGEYKRLKDEAAEHLGANAGKGLVARFMAKKLTEEENIPDFIRKIIEAIRVLGLEDDVP